MSSKERMQAAEDQFVERAREYGVPEYMIPGLVMYYMEGKRPGSFLMAVVENDLMMAFAHADGNNTAAMSAYANLLYNTFPIGSFGSPENVDKWVAVGGLCGYVAEREREREEKEHVE